MFGQYPMPNMASLVTKKKDKSGGGEPSSTVRPCRYDASKKRVSRYASTQLFAFL